MRNFLFILLFIPINIIAQRPGVTALGYSDRDIDQLKGKVKSVSEKIYKVDYSSGEVKVGEFIAAWSKDYNESGDLILYQSLEESGFLLSKTIYEYPKCSVSYDANGNRTLETLYSFTADNLCARMRFRDAMGVTISTSEISHYERHSREEETFVDGNYIRRDYYYNKNKRLTRIIIVTDKKEKREINFSLNKLGFTKKETTNGKGKKVITYSYTVDDFGNWTTRIASVNGSASEITIRKISYY